MHDLFIAHQPNLDAAQLLAKIKAVSDIWEPVEVFSGNNVLICQSRLHGKTAVAPAQSADQRHLLFKSGNVYAHDPARAMPAGQATLDADHCLARYLAQGIGFVEGVQGDFNLVIYDRARDVLTVVNDRYGLRPFYYHGRDGLLVAGNDLGTVVDCGLAPKALDRLHLAAFLYLTKLKMGDETAFKDLRVQPEASVLTWEKGRLAIRRYWRDRHLGNAKGTIEELGREAAERFRAGVKLRIGDGRKYALGLTGGLDSRSIAASLQGEDKGQVGTFSWGAPGNTEVVISEKVAKTAGLGNQFIELGPEDFARAAGEFMAYQAEPDLFIQGHMLRVAEKMSRGHDALLTGLSLGSTLGGYFVSDDLINSQSDEECFAHLVKSRSKMPPEVFRPEIRQNILPEIVDRLRVNYLEVDQPKKCERYDSFVAHGHHNRVLFPRDRTYRKYIDMAFPTFDYHFMDFVRTLPPEARKRHTIFPHFLSCLSPELAAIPYNKTMLPATVPAAYWDAAMMQQGQWEQLLRNIYLQTGGKTFVPYNAFYTNFDEWMRLDRGFMAFVDQVLPAGEAAIYDTVADRRYVRDMVQEHRQAKNYRFSEILYLMSLELFLRRHA